ncbi:hybrid sensor histidine kinase/response regulator [Luteibacter sp. NPDC031894]|uniref:hybrid sensor histidine kinase/response regulator n=1 Tax=Luteibacter sp. NPDC031894 TaxID=3390572 RepID=UPI003D00C547
MRRFVVVALGLFAFAVMATEPANTETEARKRWIADHPTLRIAVDPQQGSEISGRWANPLVNQYLALVSRHTGLRFVTVRTRSWEESVRAFNERRIDMLPSLSDRLLAADVGDRALVSKPFYVGRTVIISRTVGPAELDMRALEGRTVAFKGGGAYESWLRREHPSITRLPLADIHQVLAAVESGIADAGLGVDVAYHPIVRRDYALSLRIAGNVTEMPISVRVAVRKDAPELLAIIDDSLRNIGPDDSRAVIERWLETAYLRAPTLSQVASAYRVEIGLGVALIVVLVFALWQLRRAQLASRRGERQKTMLLAVMSHEVRNAVNAVVSSVDLLSRTPMDGAQRDLMAIAQSSSRSLRNLLKSALDYTRSESEGFTSDLAACDVIAVAREVIDGQRAAIEHKGLAVRLDLPMGALPWLLLDETRVRQLMENLLSNAVKFTEHGHVGMALWQTANEGTDEVRYFVLEVFDTGIGVPPARQSELFRPFSQAHGAHSRRMGGTGLGLGICAEIVHQLGGRLDLSSDPGSGTSVRVELPTSRIPVAPVAAEAIEAAKAQAPEVKGTVLLVEDHPANRQIIAAQLAFLGYGTHAVDHGQAAIDAFVPGAFAGVLLDCELPDMQGYDIAAELRAREVAAGGTHTRFIAISARDGEAHVRRCEESGIDAVLGKPLSLDGLRDAIAGARGTSIAERTFREEAVHDIAAIRAALQDASPERALHVTHRLKGAALILGETALARDVERMEALLQARPMARGDIDELLGQIVSRL